MLRIAFVGPTRAGKSSAINSLIGARSAPIGLGNTTKAVAEYSAKIDGTKCTLIDTPADYPLTKLPSADVVLYVVEVGNIDDAHWTKFRTYFAEFNKPKSVPVHIAILITKCDTLSARPPPPLNQTPLNILIAEDNPVQNTDDLDSYYDPVIITAINLITEKYSDACPVIPFNAHGRAAFNSESTPDLAKTEGRKAITNGHTNFSVAQFYDIKTTSAEFHGLRKIMYMTDTLTDDIEKYETCGYCHKTYANKQCACFNRPPNMYTSNIQCSDCDRNRQYKTTIKSPEIIHGKHIKHDDYKNTEFQLYTAACLKCSTTLCTYDGNGILCMKAETSVYSFYSCFNGARACAFNIAHPCGQIAEALIKLYISSKTLTEVRKAIIQFALNGQSQFGKSPNYNPEYWNLMATHLTFDRADLASFKPKTKDEAFRLLQFSRQKSIVEKIDLYCAALRLPAESRDSLAIKCANGEVGIFADRPIKNIAELKLVFNLIPTKRTKPNIELLFSDLGETYTYTPEILAELPAIVARINCHADYDKSGLFT